MNQLTELAKAVIKRDYTNIKSVKTKGAILRPDKAGQIDLSNFAEDNTDTPDNPDVSGNGTIPDSGLNIDPGTSLSGVEQLWTGPASTVSATEITLSKEISAIGDGLQLQLQIVKTPITGGEPGATSILPVVASNEAKPQAGKYVASVPIPISILAKNLAIGKTINCAIDGIGEALALTRVSQAPVISIYVKDSKTLVITNHQGFALDQESGSNNGAFYDGQVTSANSFTKEKPVAMLPNGSTLFTGSAGRGEIKLSGVADSWSNIDDGILVYFSEMILKLDEPEDTGDLYAKLADCTDFKNPLLITKDLLKKGNQITLVAKKSPIDVVLYYVKNNSECTIDTMSQSSNGLITINSNSINLKNFQFKFDGQEGGNYAFGYGEYHITKVTAYSK